MRGTRKEEKKKTQKEPESSEESLLEAGGLQLRLPAFTSGNSVCTAFVCLPIVHQCSSVVAMKSSKSNFCPCLKRSTNI